MVEETTDGGGVVEKTRRLAQKESVTLATREVAPCDPTGWSDLLAVAADHLSGDVDEVVLLPGEDKVCFYVDRHTVSPSLLDDLVDVGAALRPLNSPQDSSHFVAVLRD